MSDAPIVIQVKPDEKQMAEWQKIMGRVAKPAEINLAMSRAINRALENIKSVTSKGVREQYTVKSKAVSAAQKIRKANKNELGGEVTYTGPGLSLHEFKLKPSGIISWNGKPTQGRKQLVIEIKKGEAKEYRGGFVQSMRGSDLHVWSRTGKASFPVKKQKGPSIAGMIEASGTAEKAQASGNEMLAKRIDHEILYMLKR